MMSRASLMNHIAYIGRAASSVQGNLDITQWWSINNLWPHFRTVLSLLTFSADDENGVQTIHSSRRRRVRTAASRVHTVTNSGTSGQEGKRITYRVPCPARLALWRTDIRSRGTYRAFIGSVTCEGTTDITQGPPAILNVALLL